MAPGKSVLACGRTLPVWKWLPVATLPHYHTATLTHCKILTSTTPPDDSRTKEPAIEGLAHTAIESTCPKYRGRAISANTIFFAEKNKRMQCLVEIICVLVKLGAAI